MGAIFFFGAILTVHHDKALISGNKFCKFGSQQSSSFIVSVIALQVRSSMYVCNLGLGLRSCCEIMLFVLE